MGRNLMGDDGSGRNLESVDAYEGREDEANMPLSRRLKGERAEAKVLGRGKPFGGAQRPRRGLPGRFLGRGRGR